MREIKFTTNFESVLKFSDKDFKIKYEEHVGNDERYLYKIDGDEKHLAVCPRCDNPVVILGIYRNIDVSPHARHTRNIDIPDVAQYNEYKLERCPYHVKRANYIKEYVPETEEPQRQNYTGLQKIILIKRFIYYRNKQVFIYHMIWQKCLPKIMQTCEHTTTSMLPYTIFHGICYIAIVDLIYTI